MAALVAELSTYYRDASSSCEEWSACLVCSKMGASSATTLGFNYRSSLRDTLAV